MTKSKKYDTFFAKSQHELHIYMRKSVENLRESILCCIFIYTIKFFPVTCWVPNIFFLDENNSFIVSDNAEHFRWLPPFFSLQLFNYFSFFSIKYIFDHILTSKTGMKKSKRQHYLSHRNQSMMNVLPI